MEKTIKTRNYKMGFKIETVLVDGKEFKSHDFTIRRAVTSKGDYIGTPKNAFYLFNKGIKPQLISSAHKVCSIGFCEKEQKWYGWSHRAIFSFGIGSQVKKGDIAYQPQDKEDFQASCFEFWNGEYQENISVHEVTNSEGVLGVEVSWTYNQEVPNEKIRGQISGVFTQYPEKFGKGEWTAKTLDDAKQMAIDFAESIA